MHHELLVVLLEGLLVLVKEERDYAVLFGLLWQLQLG